MCYLLTYYAIKQHSQLRNEKMTSPNSETPTEAEGRRHAATTTTGEHDGGRGGPCTLSESRRCTRGATARHTRGEPVSLWDSRTSARESWPFPHMDVMDMEPNAFMLGRDGWPACPGYARGAAGRACPRGMPGDGPHWTLPHSHPLNTTAHTCGELELNRHNSLLGSV